MVSFVEKANSIALMTKFVRHIFPLVDKELLHWENYARTQCSPKLAEQALASIRDKKFHCQGGSIYSIYHGVNTPHFVHFVVALQTISDYLDNLCDRVNVEDEQAFSQLHLAVTDALDPDSIPHDYYAFYPLKNDGGYLDALIAACHHSIQYLPAYHIVKPLLLSLASQYSELQTYKHLSLELRDQKMSDWVQNRLVDYPSLTVWEFAAATGSTLGMFMLAAAASDPLLTKISANKIYTAYFPWIGGLHILLDYYIDRIEDTIHGDLNLVSYYSSEQETLDRLTYFWQQALYNARELPDPMFAETIVHGLLAMYLSDPKTSIQSERFIKSSLLANASGYTRFVYALCRMLRKSKIL